MKVKVTKNTALTQLFYYTGMAGLLTCLVANLILIATAISEGIPVFVLLFITGISSIASSFVDFGPLGTLLIFIIEWRWKLFFIGLILMVIQAWLKHDASIRLTFSNFFARPVSDVKPPVRATRTIEHTATDKAATSHTVVSAEKSADTSMSSGKTSADASTSSAITIRMGTSKTDGSDDASIGHGSTAEPGKSMKRLGDL